MALHLAAAIAIQEFIQNEIQKLGLDAKTGQTILEDKYNG